MLLRTRKSGCYEPDYGSCLVPIFPVDWVIWTVLTEEMINSRFYSVANARSERTSPPNRRTVNQPRLPHAQIPDRRPHTASCKRVAKARTLLLGQWKSTYAFQTPIRFATLEWT